MVIDEPAKIHIYAVIDRRDLFEMSDVFTVFIIF